MRNLKKLLAAIVTACMLAVFAIPAYAAPTDADICKDLGVVLGSGGGVTAEYLASQPTRLQGAIMFLRLKGLEDEAKAFIVTGENFSDLEGLNETNKAILGYLKANPDLGFAGIGDNKFAPFKTMTAKEYYKVLLVALGYEEGVDFTWANVFSFAVSKGLTKLVDNEAFTVNDLCIGTVEALKATVKGGTDSLIATLVEAGTIAADKAKASGLYSAVPKALEVVSATADNFKAAKFVFNKELDSSTVKKDNFSGATFKDVKLLADKKTVLVILDTAVTEQGKSIDITVKNVKATDGTTVAETKKSVSFIDTTIPVISGAVAKNAKAIVISASEPMQVENQYTTVFDKIKIDGSSVIASSSSFDYATNKITINLASILTKGTHSIEVGGLKDWAGYTAATVTNNIDVVEDTTAPEIISAKVNNTKEIEVTFSEDVDPLAQGSFKVNGEDVTEKKQSEDNFAVFTLKFAKALDIGATVEIKVAYKNQKDVVGNEVTTEKTYSFKVSDDTTLPTATAAIEGKNKIVITFSKNMDKTTGKLKVYDKDGKQLGSDISLAEGETGITWDSASVVKINSDKNGIGLDNTDAKEIKINLTECKDATIRANALVETNITLQAVDTKKPTVVDQYAYSQGTDNKDDTITISFSEAMDEATMTNLSNYVITTTDGAIYNETVALSAYSNVSVKEVSSDKKSITIKAEGIADDTPGIQVFAIKDIAGNMVVTKTISAYDGTPLIAVAAKATEGNKIEVEFNQDVKTFAPSAFIVREGPSTTSPTAATVIAGTIDGKKVKMTLDRDIGTTTAKAYLMILKKDAVKNAFGKELTTTTGAIGEKTCIFKTDTGAKQLDDEIKPKVKAFTATTGGIIVEFSEAVNTTKVGFVTEVLLTKDGAPVDVDYTSITAIDGNQNENTITGATKIKISGLEKNKEHKIQLYPRGITVDASGNRFVATEQKAVTPK